jgi:hypothetical protein
MRVSKSVLSTLVLVLSASMSTPASAVQVVDVDFSPPDSDGLIYASGSFEWPTEGNRATATVDFSGLELVYANFSADVELRRTWWDEAIGGVNGNEYLLIFDCGSTNGCLSTSALGLATGRLETPRGFDRPCTAATLGDCSEHYDINFAIFDGVFRVAGAEPISLAVTIGDPAAIPEPASWALMILGFGAAGMMLRQRRAIA